MKPSLLPTLAAIPLVVALGCFASIDACRSGAEKQLVHDAGIRADATTFSRKPPVPPSIDGATAADCGVHHAQCGTWSCQTSGSNNCGAGATSCVLPDATAIRAVCGAPHIVDSGTDSGAHTTNCCNEGNCSAPSCGYGGVPTNGGPDGGCYPLTDGGTAHPLCGPIQVNSDAGRTSLCCYANHCTQPACSAGATDGGPDASCPTEPLCSLNNTQLGNAVLGSAAQTDIGGVFCPGANFSINVLTDRSNCGYCANKCSAGWNCIHGFCQP